MEGKGKRLGEYKLLQNKTNQNKTTMINDSFKKSLSNSTGAGSN